MLYNIQIESLLDVHSLERAYGATTYYLTTFASHFIKLGNNEPKYPDISYLNNIFKSLSPMGIGHEIDLIKRRKLLLSYIQNEEWE